MEQINRLKSLILETANASITIALNKEGKWNTTLGQTKIKFENEDLNELCKELSDYIEKERKSKVTTITSPKVFSL